MTHNWNDIFNYDPESGVLRWAISPGTKVGIGTIAGCNSRGYLVVRYKGKLWFVHRIIYEIIHGSIPAGMQIDHTNRVRDDNRIDNLRVATSSENNRNKSMHHNNTSGVIGVSWSKSTGKWEAQLMVSNKTLRLGLFTSKPDAINARLKAEKLHHGAFAQSHSGIMSTISH